MSVRTEGESVSERREKEGAKGTEGLTLERSVSEHVRRDGDKCQLLELETTPCVSRFAMLSRSV